MSTPRRDISISFDMSGADWEVLLHHMAFYGLADILHTDLSCDVKMSWHNRIPRLTASNVDQASHADGPNAIEDAVRRHLEKRRSWVDKRCPKDSGLMSPRVAAIDEEHSKRHEESQKWQERQDLRQSVLHDLVESRAWSDLRYLAALGEPCYWSYDEKHKLKQDHGASRLEMQPRQRGSEFVGTRLRPLAKKLGDRRPNSIVSGLDGSTVKDELSGDSYVSATGLATPGLVDNALVWCALWGLGQFPTVPRIDGPAITSGHLRSRRGEWFYTPIWDGQWRLARLRSVLASKKLQIAAGAGLELFDELSVRSAQERLQACGVSGIARFPIHDFGQKTSERRALRAEMITTASRQWQVVTS